MNKYLLAYHRQKNNAKRRGIEFLLTFKQWVDFWGEDIARRGRGADKLQMQRYGDVGPYAVGNIKKGYPAQNAKTAGAGRRNRASAKAAKEHQAGIDALMFQESAPEMPSDDNALNLGYQSSQDRRYTFAANF